VPLRLPLATTQTHVSVLAEFATACDQRLPSSPPMGSLIKKRRKRMRKKKHKKMLKATRWQRRAAGK
jgi:L-lactate utilization protein LutB